MPVLILALVLVVMPLFLAAPAHADVLSGSDQMFSFSHNGMNITAPLASPYFVIYGVSIGSQYSFSIYYFDAPYLVTDNGGAYLFLHGNIFAVANFYFSFSSPESVYLSWEDLEDPIFVDGGVEVNINNPLLLFGDFTNSSNVDFSSYSYTVTGSVGVLDTFSGVGSWLSGAVQNISTMFWTAESGMTVLGYLAVASLALAVILLIFYLIAGWLKFH